MEKHQGMEQKMKTQNQKFTFNEDGGKKHHCLQWWKSTSVCLLSQCWMTSLIINCSIFNLRLWTRARENVCLCAWESVPYISIMFWSTIMSDISDDSVWSDAIIFSIEDMTEWLLTWHFLGVMDRTSTFLRMAMLML